MGVLISQGLDAIMVAIDLLSKREKYVPTPTSVADTANLFFDLLVRNYSLHAVIVNYLDPKFTSFLLTELMKALGVKGLMTTSYGLKLMAKWSARTACSKTPFDAWCTNWVEVLDENAYATLMGSSTKLSPFEIDTERVTRSPVGTTLSHNDYAQKSTEVRKQIVR
ncbi:unnamed protein product [Phytophthora fragariaefolia]|uniref:Unnamed protein product n=1 Tax=Phytophthora fragariaefolia TaxID=1490495 RepID=A0A9W6YNN8_9STRA|nr:unnamed protein product [Phytophthora fragariaefolia]